MLLLIGLTAPTVAAQEVPVTGTAVPALAAFDRQVVALMARWRIPGGAVAVAKDGRLVLAHGYGRADVEANQPMQPDALFRIASISKPITAAAVLKLVEEGRLDLDAKALRLLEHLRPPEGATVDPRIGDITIRHLLTHAGGWDRDRRGDPMFSPLAGVAARAVGVPEPAECETIVRFMLSRPLDFPPGTASIYSNFGYCVLGRIIARVTGTSYEDYVKTQVLARAGVTRMRLGRTLPERRAAGEVKYYGGTTPRSVFPQQSGPVPAPYGGFYLEAMDAHGGWIASAIDLLKFVTALDGSRAGVALLSASTLRVMTARPAYYSADLPTYYAMGWSVRPTGGDATWWHNGGLAGTTTTLVRTGTRWSWAALFNARPDNADAFLLDLDRVLSAAAGEVTEWPGRDLFGQYP